MYVVCKNCHIKYDNEKDNCCPNCGSFDVVESLREEIEEKEAENKRNGFHAGDPNNPVTLDELSIWYYSNNYPPETVTRFYIGANLTIPRIFGIYQDEYTNNFIVYKNKSDGERTIRYDGPDEAYAVKQFKDRFMEEVYNQKDIYSNNSNFNYNNTTNDSSTINYNRRSRKLLITIIVILIIGFIIISLLRSYESGDRPFYDSSDSYYYDSYDDYDYYDYYDYYDSYDDYDSYDSWDSSSTDWDSDW